MWPLRHLFVVTILHTTFGQNTNVNTKIVGGYDAKEGQFPYQVSLQHNKFHFCGGSILNERWILTAGHCISNAKPSKFDVVVGIHQLDKEGVKYAVKELHVHPNFCSRPPIRDDIALIKLKKDITFNDHIKSIELMEDDLPGGEDVVLTGWGTTTYPGKSPNTLQVLNLTIISNDDCQKKYDKEFDILETNICTFTTEGEGACHGDSGGPLAYNGKQVGVVSWGTPCAKGKPDVFTRVQSYSKWIEEIVDS